MELQIWANIKHYYKKQNKTKKPCKLQKEPNEIFTTEKPNFFNELTF